MSESTSVTFNGLPVSPHDVISAIPPTATECSDAVAWSESTTANWCRQFAEFAPCSCLSWTPLTDVHQSVAQRDLWIQASVEAATTS